MSWVIKPGYYKHNPIPQIEAQHQECKRNHKGVPFTKIEKHIEEIQWAIQLATASFLPKAAPPQHIEQETPIRMFFVPFYI